LSELPHPEAEAEEAKQGTRQEQGTSETMAFGEFSQSPAAQNPNTVAGSETCQDMHVFMMNVFLRPEEDFRKVSPEEICLQMEEVPH
jgi:hypothetical protein